MAKSPKNPPRDPAKHSKKDPARPTRAKAARGRIRRRSNPALADLLNPAIGKGTAGVGAQTGRDQKPETSGLKPPPDNSFDRRADFSAAHRARKSTKGFDEAPQSGYVAQDPERAGDDQHQARAKRSATACRATRTSTSDTAPSGVTATAQALERLLREGRTEFAEQRRPDRSGRRTGRRARRSPKAAAARDQVRLRAQGRPAARDQGTGRGREAPRPHAGAARRHRLGQDLHHGEGDRGDAAPGADPRAQQDAGGAALRRVQELLPRQRGRVFRLAITTTTSRKPTSRAPTPISRRNPRSTSRSTACATRRRARCSSATT